MTYTRKNRGVCSVSTTVTLADDGTIEDVTVLGGCKRQPERDCITAEGDAREEAIQRMEGLTCGSKSTSCPDQIAKTLREALEQ